MASPSIARLLKSQEEVFKKTLQTTLEKYNDVAVERIYTLIDNHANHLRIAVTEAVNAETIVLSDSDLAVQATPKKKEDQRDNVVAGASTPKKRRLVPASALSGSDRGVKRVGSSSAAPVTPTRRPSTYRPASFGSSHKYTPTGASTLFGSAARRRSGLHNEPLTTKEDDPDDSNGSVDDELAISPVRPGHGRKTKR